MPDPIILTCECCGFSQTFTDTEEAFEAGWDEGVHLPSWPICCNICPGVGAMGLVDHSIAHEQWKITGRPLEFSTFGLPQ
jgi:hypothetical protein